MAPEINQKLLPMKAHYFIFNAGTAPVVPFMPTLARQLGYSAAIVGMIYTVLPVIGMIAKPLFGAIADRFQRQKHLFIAFQLSVAVFFFGILFIPAIPSQAQLHCHGGVSMIKYCTPKTHTQDQCIINSIVENNSNTTFSCSMRCAINDNMWKTICDNWQIPGLCKKENQGTHLKIDTVIPHNHVSQESETDCFFFHIQHGNIDGHETTLYCPANSTDFKSNCEVSCDDPSITEIITAATDEQAKSQYQFWLFFLFLAGSWVGMAVVVSVGDAICFGMLGDKPQLYGNQRLWGSVGWGTFSIISGWMIDKFSDGQLTKNYAVGFYLMIGLIALDMLISSRLKYSQTKLSSNILKDVGKIFNSSRVAVFFIWCIMVGLGTAMIWNFLFWHIEELATKQEGCNHKDWIKTLQGLIMGIQCFGGELPFFWISGWILKKIGHIHAMSMVLAGFCVRFFLYSLLVNPWLALPIELLNGVTFGIFYSTMASYASIVAPSGTEATMQGLVGAVFEGIGVSIGSLVGGYLMSSVGGSMTYRYFSYAAGICFVAHVLVQILLNKISGIPYDIRDGYMQADSLHLTLDEDLSPSDK